MAQKVKPSMIQYAQGDVLITKVASLPTGCKPIDRDNGRVILAYGEVTGHAHALSGAGTTLLMPETRSKEDERLNVRFLQIMDKVGDAVSHEEHATIKLDPGVYEVRQQQEFSDQDEPIRVQD
jgi:hypothetical protein